MQLIARFIIILLIFCSVAQAQTDTKQPRILILLDGSSSMSYEWQNGIKRFDAASRLILTLIDSVYKVNKDVEFALRVYGHQYQSQYNNCYDTKLEVMFSKDNLTQMSLRLAALNAIGVSPIAFSLKQAAENDLTDLLRNTYSLILVTDGAESCGGDICSIVKELLAKKIDFKPYILSLVDNGSLKSGYDCLGTYLPVTKDADVPAVVGKIVDNYKKILALEALPKKELASAPVKTPSIQQVTVPKVEVKKEVEIKEPPKPVVIKEPEPKPIPRETITSLGFAGTSRTFPLYYSTAVMKKQELPVYIRPGIQDEPTPKPAAKPVIANVPPPQPKPEIKKETVQNLQITKALDIKTTVEAANVAEATLQVYISDGNKTFYETTPKLVLLDKKTRKEVMRFDRTVDMQGKPRPVKVPAGDYYLSIADKEIKYGIIDLHIPPNNNTAITIPINNGSIIFSYEGNKKQIKGYEAKVFRRFSNQPPVIQKVEQELSYEPGMYHIEVNTLPPFNKTFYLEMGTQRGELIPEEGTLIIKNTVSIGKVTLYEPNGDRFRPFYSFTVDGNGTPITLPVLPGTYKAGYKKNPQLPMEEETMQVFTITSNNVTNLELNK